MSTTDTIVLKQVAVRLFGLRLRYLVSYNAQITIFVPVKGISFTPTHEYRGSDQVLKRFSKLDSCDEQLPIYIKFLAIRIMWLWR